MVETYCPLRLPLWLWTQYDKAAGAAGRSADLRRFQQWRIAHPDIELGDDVDGPHDFPAKFRVDSDQLTLFLEAVDDREASSDMRRYIWWRIQNPRAALPRASRSPACV